MQGFREELNSNPHKNSASSPNDRYAGFSRPKPRVSNAFSQDKHARKLVLVPLQRKLLHRNQTDEEATGHERPATPKSSSLIDSA